MVKSVQDATTSTGVTSGLSPIGCRIAQRPSQPPAVKKEPEKSPSGPVRSEVLARYLEGYDPVQLAYLVRGFSKGLEEESLGLDNPRLSKHLWLVLEKKLQKEIDACMIVGPFEEVPLPNLRVSPIKVAPKKEVRRG